MLEKKTVIKGLFRKGRILLACDDQPGIVAAVSGFLSAQQLNITGMDQYSEPNPGKLFMRVSFECTTGSDPLEGYAFCDAFQQQVATPFAMHWCVSDADRQKQVAILVSRHDHGLLELLWRQANGSLPMQIQCVISNHLDLQPMVEHWGVPFVHIANTPNTRSQAEHAMMQRLREDIDLVILARYMQILSAEFVHAFEHKIINIHHSFLPAFRGADPYQQAYDLGVKIIGATAHYVTETLDVGPIIDQDVVTISHRDQVVDLREKGKAVERNVLARAVKWHLEDRILVEAGKTLIFD